MPKGPSIRSFAGWLWLIGSAVLFGITVVAFWFQPDLLAAFTVIPVWVWGALGCVLSIMAWRFLKMRRALILLLVWALTVLIIADEARAYAIPFNEAPERERKESTQDGRLVRVITLNAAQFRFGDPIDDLAEWNPDIVLLQETPAHLGSRVKQRLYGDSGDWSHRFLNSIATRWEITKTYNNPDRDFRYTHHNATIKLPDGTLIDLVNLHLTSAATDMRLWSPSCWRDHRNNRQYRRAEMSGVLEFMNQQMSLPQGRPTIIAGDFNAHPTDPVSNLIDENFSDAFRMSGSGWGNTFHRRVPIFRLDQIHITDHFTPVSCRAVTTRNSDHRFVVADILIK